MNKYFLLLCAALAGCSAAKNHDLADVQWLEGKWMGHEGNNTYIESWTRVSDSLLTGSGIFLEGSDTLFREDLKLVTNEDGVAYIAFPENMVKAEFQLTEANDTLALFENPDHDFPKVLRYDLKGDSLIATLTGIENGKGRKDVFRWKKAK